MSRIRYRRQRIGRGALGGFTPTDIAGLQLWVQADKGLYQDSAGSTAASADGDPVGRWTDQSGNARNLLQTGSTKRPLLKTGVLASGKPVIRGDGVDDLLKATFTLNQPEHVFIVLRQATWTANDRVFGGSAANTMTFYQKGASPTLGTYAGAFGPETASLAVGTAGVLSILYNGASSELRLNGGAAVTGDVGAGNAGAVTLFGEGDDTLWSNVDIGQFLVYNTALSTADREDVEAYLKTWAGIA